MRVFVLENRKEIKTFRLFVCACLYQEKQVNTAANSNEKNQSIFSMRQGVTALCDFLLYVIFNEILIHSRFVVFFLDDVIWPSVL